MLAGPDEPRSPADQLEVALLDRDADRGVRSAGIKGAELDGRRSAAPSWPYRSVARRARHERRERRHDREQRRRDHRTSDPAVRRRRAAVGAGVRTTRVGAASAASTSSASSTSGRPSSWSSGTYTSTRAMSPTVRP